MQKFKLNMCNIFHFGIRENKLLHSDLCGKKLVAQCKPLSWALCLCVEWYKPTFAPCFSIRVAKIRPHALSNCHKSLALFYCFPKTHSKNISSECPIQLSYFKFFLKYSFCYRKVFAYQKFPAVTLNPVAQNISNIWPDKSLLDIIVGDIACYCFQAISTTPPPLTYNVLDRVGEWFNLPPPSWRINFSLWFSIGCCRWSLVTLCAGDRSNIFSNRGILEIGQRGSIISALLDKTPKYIAVTG